MPGAEQDNRKKQAVALRYDRQREAAPRVVAKGAGATADNIVAVAEGNDVPVYVEPQLVQQLMRLDLAEVIPPALYQVVAEVLAYVYRLDRRAEKAAGFAGRSGPGRDGGHG